MNQLLQSNLIIHIKTLEKPEKSETKSHNKRSISYIYKEAPTMSQKSSSNLNS